MQGVIGGITAQEVMKVNISYFPCCDDCESVTAVLNYKLCAKLLYCIGFYILLNIC